VKSRCSDEVGRETGTFGRIRRSLAQGDLEAGLLRFLREELEEPGLAYAEAPELIPGGAAVHVHGFRLASRSPEYSRPLVVRVWRAATAADAASFESCLQNTLAELGYPVPRVLLHCDDSEKLGASGWPSCTSGCSPPRRSSR
jgi:hypothetical protein